MSIKNRESAQELGRRRWRGVDAAARNQHARFAVAERERMRARERDDARSRIPRKIRPLLDRAMRDGSARAYYGLGYRLGIALLTKAARTRVIRSLESKGEYWQGICIERHLSESETRTLAAMVAAPLDRLALDRTKLANWDGKKASTSLRAILKDPALVLLIPCLRHHVFLLGLHTGASGDAISYRQSSSRP
jgi:hypothetical protein